MASTGAQPLTTVGTNVEKPKATGNQPSLFVSQHVVGSVMLNAEEASQEWLLRTVTYSSKPLDLDTGCEWLVANTTSLL